MDNIRNFCIIAHIDHGKSTLADRLLEYTNTIGKKDLKEQVLDDMELERERGITIKSHAIQMNHKHEDVDYVLNLIDTPGHVDFSYEVSRSIASCEGALLIVDATQGIQAQTISNLFLALDNDLTIIPIINKIDMVSAMVEEVKEQIVDIISCNEDEVLEISAKTGEGVMNVLTEIINRVPAPKGDIDAPFNALIFDSVYNSYRGVIAYFRIFNGKLNKGDHLKFLATNDDYHAEEIGVLELKNKETKSLAAGDVGYIILGIKDSKNVKVGDTITHVANPTKEAIKGFKDVQPMVYAGVYPIDPENYEELRNSMEKLKLNDASITFTPESSLALGFGFNCGFLGLLHMEIIQERLDREFGMSVITTVPSVSYNVHTSDDKIVVVTKPSDLPEPKYISFIEEPYIYANVITKSEYIGSIINLCIEKRGTLLNQVYITKERAELSFEIPLNEIVFDFYDKLKSISKGYASFDYSPSSYKQSNLVRLDILLNKEPVDALSALIHRDNAYNWGKKICLKLKELIPRQYFDIAIQAAISSKIIARETVKALRKDVTAKCYGGDITRKRKLLEKQKKGRKKMKQIGNVEVPQKAFLSVLKLD